MKKYLQYIKKILPVVMIMSTLAAAIALAAPYKAKVITPKAEGSKVEKNSEMIIDYSNASSGYVMVKYLSDTDKKLKTQVQSPKGVTYTYNLKVKEWAALPFSEGNGAYKVTVYKNISGTSYATVGSATVNVELSDSMLPFLTASQYVNYTTATKCVKQAEKICKKKKDELEKVKAVYDWTLKKFQYSTLKAKTVESGYLPELDKVYDSKKAICFDYAATMTAMLRSQGIPTKLVIGYSGSAYHAWIDVYTEKSGWITGVIYFDGKKWSLMDPTYADTAKSDEKVKEYVGNAGNYRVKYVY